MHVLVVDDHRLFLDGLQALLVGWRGDVQVVTAGRLADAIEQLRRAARFDLVLLDLTLPDALDPVHTVQRLVAAAAGAPVIAVSMLVQADLVTRVIGAGARGFIRKTDSAELMLAAIEVVRAGGVHVPADTLKPATLQRPPEPPLSERQCDVLELIARGWSNKEIARERAIAETTVKVHVHRILQVLGLTTRARVAVWARETSFTPPGRRSGP